MKQFCVQYQPYQGHTMIEAASFQLPAEKQDTVAFYGEDKTTVVAQFRLSELIGWWEVPPVVKSEVDRKRFNDGLEPRPAG